MGVGGSSHRSCPVILSARPHGVTLVAAAAAAAAAEAATAAAAAVVLEAERERLVDGPGPFRPSLGGKWWLLPEMLRVSLFPLLVVAVWEEACPPAAVG